MSPEAILDPLPIDRSAKAAAWDAVQSAQTPDELRDSMDSLPLPKAAKAALWDIKSNLWQAQPDAHFSVHAQPVETPEIPPVAPMEDAAPPMAASVIPADPSAQTTDNPQPAQKPQPVVNASEFLKAHNVWKKSTTEAAAKFMQDNPGTPYEDAERAIAGTTGIEPKIDDFKALPQTPEPSLPLPPREPVEASKVQKVSPATPIPPTAAIPTQTESPETIALQVSQLGQFGTPVHPDQRKVVMFPGGQGQPIIPPAGLALANDGLGNTYLFRPDLITRSAIRTAARNNTLTEILGGPAGMGAPDKSALQGPPIAVTGKDANGVEAQTTVTDAQSLPHTVLATHAVTPLGGRIEIKAPNQALQDRDRMVSATPKEVIPSLPKPQALLPKTAPAAVLPPWIALARNGIR